MGGRGWVGGSNSGWEGNGWVGLTVGGRGMGGWVYQWVGGECCEVIPLWLSLSAPVPGDPFKD